MARLLRVDRPSVWYQLTARGNEQRLTFRDDRDPERSAVAGVGRSGRLLFVECSKLTPIHACFIEELTKGVRGTRAEPFAGKKLARRPTFGQVIAVVEKLKA